MWLASSNLISSSKKMDNTGSEHTLDEAGGQSSSFSAVLQEIFQQTQTEIQARNRNVRLIRLASGIPSDFQSHDTYRYEPLVDPALSYISDILADEDERSRIHASLSCNEIVAYQAKKTEVAALLTEDSPALRLKIDPESLGSRVGDGSIVTSEEVGAAGADMVNFLDMESATVSNPVSEPFRNELLLSSLRGPGNRLRSFGDAQVLDTSGSPESQGEVQLAGQDTPENTDDFAAKSHVQRSQKPHKSSGKVLKPRKETAKKGKARSSRDRDQEFVDINALLLQSAQAVGAGNMKRAMDELKKVRQHASPYGNGAQRLAYYFAEAMDARFSDTGWQLYLGLLRRRPSSSEILKATAKYMASCPFVKASHYFINQTILNVAKGASIVHILDLQITGFQYPSLFQALAARPGGPPQVHLIGVGFPHYSMMPARTELVLEGVEKTGRQLSDYAASCRVPFEYTPWAGSREDLRMQDFVSPDRKTGEIFVVVSAYLLRYVMDDLLDSPSGRSKLLKEGRDINPDVYIQGIVTGSYSTPFFPRRFREALFHFESVFDMLDTFIEGENTDRLVFESEILGKAILNIVACEGKEVADRIHRYKHWQAVTEEVGFEQLPLDEEIYNNVQVMLKTWHKEYTVAEDSQYLLMGWKGRMLHAMSTWKAMA